jgi:hypothetical protein
MSKKKLAATSRREKVICVLITIVGCALIFLFRAPDRWLAAIFCTVPTLSGLVPYFWQRIPRPAFWSSMSVVVILHALLIWGVFGILLRNVPNVGLLVCVPGIFLESFLIYRGVLLFVPVAAGLAGSQRAE